MSLIRVTARHQVCPDRLKSRDSQPACIVQAAEEICSLSPNVVCVGKRLKLLRCEIKLFLFLLNSPGVTRGLREFLKVWSVTLQPNLPFTENIAEHFRMVDWESVCQMRSVGQASEVGGDALQEDAAVGERLKMERNDRQTAAQAAVPETGACSSSSATTQPTTAFFAR